MEGFRKMTMTKFFEYSDNFTEPLDEQINNWQIDRQTGGAPVIVIDIKFTSQYIFNISYEGIRDTALIIYEELE